MSPGIFWSLEKATEYKLVQPLQKTEWRLLTKLKREFPYDPASPLLGIHSDKTIIQKETCIPTFTAALFTILKTCKQPKCPSADEWIKMMRYTYPVEYYPAIKKNEIMPFAATWMDIDIIILSEVSQKNHTIPYSMVSLTVKESESQSCLPLCNPMD